MSSSFDVLAYRYVVFVDSIIVLCIDLKLEFEITVMVL